MEVDVAESVDETPFKRAVALLLGATAVLSALLVGLEANAGASSTRAANEGSRLAVVIAQRVGASSSYNTFKLRALRESVSLRQIAVASEIDAIQDPRRRALARAQATAAAQVGVVAGTMARMPTTREVDAEAVDALRGRGLQRTALPAAQSAAIDESIRYGHRHARALFALAMVGIASALFGLAGLIGAGRSGAVALGSGGAALLVTAISTVYAMAA
jgi:hypothetical protein